MEPQKLKFLPSHEWAHLDGDVATIGISQFAVDQLTDLIMIDLPRVGATLTPGKGFGEVESVKAVSDLYAPVAGEVVEVNDAVVSDVQVLAQDPYGAGWLVKVRLADPAAGLAGLLDYDAYRAKVAEDAHCGAFATLRLASQSLSPRERVAEGRVGGTPPNSSKDSSWGQLRNPSPHPNPLPGGEGAGNPLGEAGGRTSGSIRRSGLA